MSGMLFAEPAVFLILHPVGVFALVLGVVIIPAFAVHASQGDYLSHFIIRFFNFRLTTCLFAVFQTVIPLSR
jgi:hypothetical protein